MSSRVLALSLRSTQLGGSPLSQSFSNCGPRPLATGIPGVLAKMQISGVQLKCDGLESLGVGLGNLIKKKNKSPRVILMYRHLGLRASALIG